MKHAIQKSLERRKQIIVPSFHGLATFIILCVSLYLFLVFHITPLENKTYHFGCESGAVSVLSGMLMAMAGGFAGAAFILSKEKKFFYRSFWLLAAFTLLFFSLDEILAFHERLGGWMNNTGLGPIQSFRNWNDVIVIGYGIAALGILTVYLPEILKYPRFIEMMTIAFLFFCMHTFIDSTQEPWTMVSVILEESAKIYCVTFLALAMFIGLLGVIFNNYELRGE